MVFFSYHDLYIAFALIQLISVNFPGVEYSGLTFERKASDCLVGASHWHCILLLSNSKSEDIDCNGKSLTQV